MQCLPLGGSMLNNSEFKINSEICNSEFPVPEQLILVQSTLSMFSPSQVHACDTKSSSIELQYHNHYSNR